MAKLERLRRFLSPQVADAIVSSTGNESLLPHRREIAVVFCDLRGFTAAAAAAEPEEITALLTSYHEVVGTLVDAHAATVGAFAGDGVMLTSTTRCRATIPPARPCSSRSTSTSRWLV